jgi:hypothetical protein
MPVVIATKFFDDHPPVRIILTPEFERQVYCNVSEKSRPDPAPENNFPISRIADSNHADERHRRAQHVFDQRISADLLGELTSVVDSDASFRFFDIVDL